MAKRQSVLPPDLLLRDLILLAAINGCPTDADTLNLDYPMITSLPPIPARTLKDALEKLMACGVIRYASTGQGELHQVDIKAGHKWYVITAHGKSMLEDAYDMCCRSGIIPRQKP